MPVYVHMGTTINFDLLSQLLPVNPNPKPLSTFTAATCAIPLSRLLLVMARNYTLIVIQVNAQHPLQATNQTGP